MLQKCPTMASVGAGGRFEPSLLVSFMKAAGAMSKRIWKLRRVVGVVGIVVSTCSSGGRVGAWPTSGALPPVLAERVVVAGVAGVPADAAMVVVSVAAVSPAEAGFLVAYSCDESVPTASNVNYFADEVRANMAIVRVDAGGGICVATSALTDVLVDVHGYVPATSSIEPLAVPTRAIDTRESSIVSAGSTLHVPVAGGAPVPDSAVVNVTAVGATAPGYLAVFACDQPVPATSSVNFAAGAVVPNVVVTRLDKTGEVCVHASTDVHVVVDVMAVASTAFELLDAPVRLVDTRQSGRLPAGTELPVRVTAAADRAAVVNVAAVDPAAAGFLSIFPCGQRPATSNINYAAWGTVASGAISGLNANGELCVFTHAATDVIVDLVGYTAGPVEYVPVEPFRARDTRVGVGPRCSTIAYAPTWSLRTATAFPLTIIDTATGAQTSADVVGPSDGVVIRAFVAHNCGSIVIAWWDRTAEAIVVDRYTFDGGHSTATYQSVDDDWGRPRVVGELADGTLVHSHSRGIVAMDTQEFIVDFNTLPGNHFAGYGIGWTPDLSTMYVAPNQTTINVIDPRSGTVLWSSQTSGNDETRHLSPDSAYLLIDQWTGSSVARIVTVFGDQVDQLSVFQDSGQWRWWGKGTLIGCAYGSTYQWNLYGPVTEILPPLDGSAAAHSCGDLIT